MVRDQALPATRTRYDERCWNDALTEYVRRTTLCVGLSLHQVCTGLTRPYLVDLSAVQVKYTIHSNLIKLKRVQSKVQRKWPLSDSVRCTRTLCPSRTGRCTKVHWTQSEGLLMRLSLLLCMQLSVILRLRLFFCGVF